jgi:hypothetical protein
MASTFFDITKLRLIQETEVDYDSPFPEELATQLKENNESLFHLNYFTGTSGVATTAPTSEYFFDANASWSDDAHNLRTLVILSGAAVGNYYSIDDSVTTCTGSGIVAGEHALYCVGDNLSGDGIVKNDKYKVFYNLQSTSGHKHNAVDSAEVTLSKGRVCAYSFYATTHAGSTAQHITSTGALTSLSSRKTIQIYIPTNPTKLYLSASLRRTGSDEAQIRLQTSSTHRATDIAQRTNAAFAWVSPTTGLNCSTMVTGFRDFKLVLAKSDGSNKAFCNGFNIVWGE